jgi:hypothetical protein
LDDVRIWNRVLTVDEIRLNMHLHRTGSETGLIGYWRLDDAEGTTAEDVCARSNLVLNSLDADDWTSSPVPIGVGSSAIISLPAAPASVEFPEQGLSFNLSSSAVGQLCVHQVELPVAPVVTGFDAVYNNPVRIIHYYGSAGVQGSSKFTASDFFYALDELHPANTKLLRRDIASFDDVQVVDTAQSLSFGAETATFPSFTGSGLFLLAKTNAIPDKPLASISKDTSGDFIRLDWELIPGADWYGIYVADEPDADFGPEYGAPDYYTDINYIILPANLNPKCFYKVSAGSGTMPLRNPH